MTSTPCTARRAAINTVVGIVALAGVATLTATPAVAAPATPVPAFTDGEPGLAAMLLDGPEASGTLGSPVEVARTFFRLGDNSSVRPSQCLSAYLAAQSSAYSSTSPVDIAAKRLTGTSALVTEAVVELPSKREALAFLESTADRWAECGGITMSERSQEDGSVHQWKLGTPTVNDNRTIVSLSQTLVGGRATCERAMASYQAIVIDVLTCTKSGSSAGMAEAVVEAIGEKASQTTV